MVNPNRTDEDVKQHWEEDYTLKNAPLLLKSERQKLAFHAEEFLTRLKHGNP